jgi:hypothetical protein
MLVSINKTIRHHNPKDHNPNIIKGMRWVRHVTCMGEMNEIYRILVGKSEGKV